MNQIGFWIVVLEIRELIFKEEAGRIGSNSVLNDLSRVELNDEKDIEADEAEDVYGKEVAGKERVPMSGEELLPGESWL